MVKKHILNSVILLAFCLTAKSQRCPDCTHTYSSNTNQKISISSGMKVYIAPGVVCSGEVSITGGTLINYGTVTALYSTRIVSEASINNFGTINEVGVDISSGARVTINNYRGARYEFAGSVNFITHEPLSITIHDSSEMIVNGNFTKTFENFTLTLGSVNDGKSPDVLPDKIKANLARFRCEDASFINSPLTLYIHPTGEMDVQGFFNYNEEAGGLHDGNIYIKKGTLNINKSFISRAARGNIINGGVVNIVRDFSCENNPNTVSGNGAINFVNNLGGLFKVGGNINLNNSYNSIKNYSVVNVTGNINMTNGVFLNEQGTNTQLNAGSLACTGGTFTNNYLATLGSVNNGSVTGSYGTINNGGQIVVSTSFSNSGGIVNLSKNSVLATTDFYNLGGSIKGPALTSSEIEEGMRAKLFISGNSQNASDIGGRILVLDNSLTCNLGNANYGFDNVTNAAAISNAVAFGSQCINGVLQFVCPWHTSLRISNASVVSPSFTICSGRNLMLTAEYHYSWGNPFPTPFPTVPSPPTFTWMPGGQSGTTLYSTVLSAYVNYISVSPTATTIYTVLASTSASCPLRTETVTVTICNPQPVISYPIVPPFLTTTTITVTPTVSNASPGTYTFSILSPASHPSVTINPSTGVITAWGNSFGIYKIACTTPSVHTNNCSCEPTTIVTTITLSTRSCTISLRDSVYSLCPGDKIAFTPTVSVFTHYGAGYSSISTWGNNSLLEGLQGFYPMDTSVANRAAPGAALNGTIVGSVTTAIGHTGASNTAYDFGGTGSDCILLPSDYRLKPHAISVSAWVKFTNISNPQFLVFAKNICGGWFEGYALNARPNGSNYMFNLVKSGNGCNGTTQQTIIGNTAIKSDTWYHVAFYIGSDSLKLYVNGSVDAEAASKVEFSYGSDKVVLGGTNVSYSNPAFSGIMDNVLFYNRKLNKQEINALYKLEPTVNQNKINDSDNLLYGLQGCYTMDGSAANNAITGAALNGTVVGSVTTAIGHTGANNSAYDFGGTGSDCILLPNDSRLKPKTISVSAWVKFTNTVNPQFLVFAKNICGGWFEGYALNARPNSSNYKFNLVKAGNGCGGATQQTIIGNTAIKIDTWYHVAIYIGGDSLKLYVNGKVDAEAASKVEFNYSSDKVVLGGTNVSYSNPAFSGLMDNVRFYNRKLSISEINFLYTRDPACNENVRKTAVSEHGNLREGLQAYFSLDGNAENSAITGAALNGTVTGNMIKAVGHTGIDNTAYDFGGTGSDCILLPNDSKIKPETISVSAWVKFTNTVNPQFLVFAKNICGGWFEGYALNARPNGSNYTFNLVKAGNGCGGATQQTIIGNTAIKSDTWYNVGFYIGGDSLRLYVNGKVDAEAASKVAFNYSSDKVVLGGTNVSYSNPAFSGLMDNVRFYNRRLGAGEFRGLFLLDPPADSDGNFNGVSWSPGPASYTSGLSCTSCITPTLSYNGGTQSYTVTANIDGDICGQSVITVKEKPYCEKDEIIGCCFSNYGAAVYIQNSTYLNVYCNLIDEIGFKSNGQAAPNNISVLKGRFESREGNTYVLLDWIHNAKNDLYTIKSGTTSLFGANQKIKGNSNTHFNELWLEGNGTKSIWIDEYVYAKLDLRWNILSIQNFNFGMKMPSSSLIMAQRVLRSSGYATTGTKGYFSHVMIHDLVVSPDFLYPLGATASTVSPFRYRPLVISTNSAGTSLAQYEISANFMNRAPSMVIDQEFINASPAVTNVLTTKAPNVLEVNKAFYHKIKNTEPSDTTAPDIILKSFYFTADGYFQSIAEWEKAPNQPIDWWGSTPGAGASIVPSSNPGTQGMIYAMASGTLNFRHKPFTLSRGGFYINTSNFGNVAGSNSSNNNNSSSNNSNGSSNIITVSASPLNAGMPTPSGGNLNTPFGTGASSGNNGNGGNALFTPTPVVMGEYEMNIASLNNCDIPGKIRFVIDKSGNINPKSVKYGLAGPGPYLGGLSESLYTIDYLNSGITFSAVPRELLKSCVNSVTITTNFGSDHVISSPNDSLAVNLPVLTLTNNNTLVYGNLIVYDAGNNAVITQPGLTAGRTVITPSFTNPPLSPGVYRFELPVTASTAPPLTEIISGQFIVK